MRKVEAVVMGGSAGALEALSVILPALSADFEPPLVIVLHLAADKPSYLAAVLGHRCPLAVREVEDKAPVLAGTVHVAPPGYHLLIERERHFALSVDDPLHYSRPAVDVLFESAAEAYGPGLLGLLLTGANEDGARGLARIKECGGTTVVQSPRDAEVSTMPEAALRLATPDQVLALADIGPFLNRVAGGGGSARRPSPLISPERA